MIVREILMVGGSYDYEIDSPLFSDFLTKVTGPPHSKHYSKDDSIRDVFLLLGMLVCNGLKLESHVIGHIERMTTGTVYDNLLMKYFTALLDGKTDSLNAVEQKRMNELKIQLKCVMEELFETATNKRFLIPEIEKLTCIPLCIVGIVFEYQRCDKLKYIDWLKF